MSKVEYDHCIVCNASLDYIGYYDLSDKLSKGLCYDCFVKAQEDDAKDIQAEEDTRLSLRRE